MKTNPNDPAYAAPPTISEALGSTVYNGSEGLTKRELFAAMAMEGICRNNSEVFTVNGGFIYPKAVAENAVALADALILALNESETTPTP